ncbi:MAG: glycosyltransferase [Nitrososphaerota archaeon]|nr:glycosyltransferase [Nitrososphaerota archaeon]
MPAKPDLNLRSLGDPKIGSKTGPRVLVIAPGDVESPHSGNVEFARSLAQICLRSFQTDIFYFKGHSMLRTSGRNYLHFPSWIVRLSSALLSFDGVVVVVHNSRITTWTCLTRRIFRKKYHVVAALDNLSKGGKKIGRLSESVALLLSLHLVDAIFYNPFSVRSEKLVTFQHPLLSFPGALVDAEEMYYSTESGKRTRQLLGIGHTAKVVGIIGPYHRFNASSLKYLKNNLPSFNRDIIFLIIGECPSSLRFKDDRVIFAGRVERFSDGLSACDVVLIPRFVSYGSPMNKMIHAMAIERPVVTNSFENLPIKSGVEAVKGELEQLPSLVNSLFDDPTQRSEMGKRARRFVIENFSVQTLEGRLNSFIKNY